MSQLQVVGRDNVLLPRCYSQHPVFLNIVEAQVYAWIVSCASAETGVIEILQAREAADFGLSLGAFRGLVQAMIDAGMLTLVLDYSPRQAGIVVQVNREFAFTGGYPSKRPMRRPSGRRALSASKRAQVISKAGGHCYYCDDPLSLEPGPQQFHADHKTALHHGGSDHLANLVASCRSCNLRKGKRRLSTFLAIGRRA